MGQYRGKLTYEFCMALLTKRQQAIILGAVLGDSTVEKAWKNPRIRFAHSIKQQEYLFWKYNEFKDISCKPALIRERHWKTDKIYESWQFNTHALDELHYYRNFFYPNGKKIIQDQIINVLTNPLSLAVWFMDDGYKRNDCNALRLNTDSFSLPGQILLQSALEKNFEIKSTLHRKGEYWNIYIPESSVRRFVQIVKPYILPSLAYKISLAP